jgi:hypothetical protein
MAWDDKIQLENFIVCGAPFGGPIAMVYDTKRPAQQSAELDAMKNKLFVKTSSGNHISEIEWDDKPIVGMGWSDLEHLITVLENGIQVFSFGILSNISITKETLKYSTFMESY